MKKLLTVLCLALVLVTGCKGNEEPKTVDLNELATTLLNDVEFEDTLTKLNDKMINKVYEIDNYKTCTAYVGSGATAEEIALFEFETQEDANEGYEQMQKRVEKQKKDYANYIPKEVKRLDDAVVIKYGNYVIFCVAEGNEAKEIINSYTK